MRRDEVVPRAGVERQPVYLGGSGDALFAWYHEEHDVRPLDSVAVICGPIGHEYTRAHRSLRHLADRLAHAGIPALRFDYHGSGDSPGTDLDPGRLERWQADILAAIAGARQLSGRSRVTLIGVRLGASLAALATTQAGVDRLVLWNPCVFGRRYLRELQAIAQSAAQLASDGSGMLECAGFALSAETVAALRSLDLTAHTLQVRERVLIVGRDDLAADTSLDAHLAALGIAFDQVTVPGWAGMVAEHQFTVVPHVALATIVDWLHRGQSPFVTRNIRTDGLKQKGTVPGVTMFVGKTLLSEEACRFGDEGRLFGILSRTDAGPDKPAVLLFNAGAVHHVGPNRIYVSLARELAAMGFACLRFDLEGIGDSIARDGRRENHPYPDAALEDVRAAIACLRERHGYSRFIALGLCSGAHTAFHAGLAVDGEDIAELVLINPLTFYWQEGMSLETVNNFTDAQAYRKSARDPARWLKLLRGQVNMKRLIEVILAQSKTRAKTCVDVACEALLPSRAPRLSRDLNRLIAMKRPVTFLIAEGDPGRDILMAGARRTASRALAAGQIRLDMIPGGDHTFSQWRPRQRLLTALSSHLQRHLPAAKSLPH